MADEKELKELKIMPATSRTGGPQACQAMCMHFAEKLIIMAKVAESLDIKESAIAFDCAFAAIAIVPYVIEKGLELEFMARLGELVINFVDEHASDELSSPEGQRLKESALSAFRSAILGGQDKVEEDEDKIIH